MKQSTPPALHPTSKATKNVRAPLIVLGTLTVVFVLLTPVTIDAWQKVWRDWRARAFEGTVIGIQLLEVERPEPRAAGPWRIVWQFKCDPSGPDEPRHASVIAIGSYSSAAAATEHSQSDLGRRVSVWLVPGDDRWATLNPPNIPRGLFAAAWTTAVCAMGWLGVAACVQLCRFLRPKLRRTTNELGA